MSALSKLATDRMHATLHRLLADAPKLEDANGKPRADQAPAIECQITLKSGVAMQGALSVTPEGGLRMLSPNQTRGGQLVMVEHFFDYEQVSCVSIPRQVTTTEQQASPIIHSPS